MAYNPALEQLRFEYENHLFHDLHEAPEIRAWQQQDSGITRLNLQKRHLLGTAVKITDMLKPDLYRIYQDCLERLGSGLSGNLYVYHAPEYNAHVHAYEQRFDMVLTSALIKEFKPTEIAFVIGHELGHVLFQHNTIPAAALLFSEQAAQLPASLAKKLFQWSRAAEISADRIGFLTCGDLCGAANAFFKTASGIHLENDNQVLRALRAQFEEIAQLTTELGSQLRYAATHPLIPIRFKSLELISLDLLVLRNSGKSIKPRDLNHINQQVQQVLLQTEPLNIDAPVQEPPGANRAEMVAVLVLALLWVASSDGELTEPEETFIRGLHQRFGNLLQLEVIINDCRRTPTVFQQEAKAELAAHQVSQDDILQIIHHCAMMVKKTINQQEIKTMREICKTLGGTAEIVDAVLNAL